MLICDTKWTLFGREAGSGHAPYQLRNPVWIFFFLFFSSERIVSDNMDTKRESWPSIIIGSAGHEQRDFEEDMHAHGQSELDTPQVVYYTEAVTRASFQEIITG